MINIVKIEDLDKTVADTILKVYEGVALARANGNFQVELPPKIDFSMVVVAENGWQALEHKVNEDGTTKGDGITTGTEVSKEKGTVLDHQTSQENQGGTTTETRDSAGKDNSTTDTSKTDDGRNEHIENSKSTQTNRSA